jgi:hypothetical protein
VAVGGLGGTHLSKHRLTSLGKELGETNLHLASLLGCVVHSYYLFNSCLLVVLVPCLFRLVRASLRLITLQILHLYLSY